MRARIVAFCVGLARWARYLYFLRFSIFLWLFPLVLVVANSPNAARSLVSGIVTPSRAVQYLCVAFFLISASFVSLILARVVIINGQERFGHDAPAFLVSLFANDTGRYEWLAPALFQINNVIVFWYFFSNGNTEGVNSRSIALGLGAGTVLAFVFWYAMTAFYYLTYHPGAGGSTVARFGKVSARTLMLPRTLMALGASVQDESFGDVLEDCSTPITFDWIARFFPISGYRWQPQGDLYEGHYFALVAAFGFFGLYWALCPLTAPVTVSRWSWLSLALYMLGGLLVLAFIFSAEAKKPADTQKLRTWKVILGVLVLGFSTSLPFFYFLYDAERFPILALVLILVTSISWTMGAIAFFADRYRVPVLTLLVAAMILPRLTPFYNGHEEHYLSIALRNNQAQLSTPAQILTNRLAKDPDRTFIVVTSTGGGIHAAVWTAAILEQLEQKFQQQPSPSTFHDHILLLSTVSGGSAGLYTYLRELAPATNGGAPDWSRMTTEAKCSSLEAIGWGLVYYDVPKALVPLAPYVWPLSSGVDDLKRSPIGKDRTWALRRAFARNLNDPFCQLPNNSNQRVPLSQLRLGQQANPDERQALTVANLDPILDPMQDGHPLPAFTMNTTTVEGGYRFLSANYQVLYHQPDQLNPQPAESFLQVYGDQRPDKAPANSYPDLPLATGAQLSATFPYVSSAATFPATDTMQTVHFVDGGYYDNDGTASAIEFLRSALDGQPSGAAPIRVLLVEIRNSPDSPEKQVCCNAIQKDPCGRTKVWNIVNQLVAPLQAFYGAGHESVTDRNRNSLILLEGAYKDRLILQHFVIDDEFTVQDPTGCTAKQTPPTDPLNWSLTPAQQDEVIGSAKASYNLTKYDQIKNCFADNRNCPAETPQSTPSGTQPAIPQRNGTQ